MTRQQIRDHIDKLWHAHALLTDRHDNAIYNHYKKTEKQIEKIRDKCRHDWGDIEPAYDVVPASQECRVCGRRRSVEKGKKLIRIIH